MQNVEFCRYRAEIAEDRAAKEEGLRREASLATARQWRELARIFEELDQSSVTTAAERSSAGE